MATASRDGGTSKSSKSFFEQQREALVGEISVSLEQVLQNMNKLNRSLEGVIAVGNEFSSVEALWSQFETVMAKQEESQSDSKAGSENDESREEAKGQERT